jgi:hypothetical protein
VGSQLPEKQQTIRRINLARKYWRLYSSHPLSFRTSTTFWFIAWIVAEFCRQPFYPKGLTNSVSYLYFSLFLPLQRLQFVLAFLDFTFLQHDDKITTLNNYVYSFLVWCLLRSYTFWYIHKVCHASAFIHSAQIRSGDHVWASRLGPKADNSSPCSAKVPNVSVELYLHFPSVFVTQYLILWWTPPLLLL